MAKTVVEVNLVSAIDLHDGNSLTRMSPCAVISLDQLNLHQTSKVAVDGDTHPVWNERLAFLVDAKDLARLSTATVRIYPSSAMSGEPLGTALIPVTPGNGASQDGGLHAILRPNGKKQGYLSASVRVAPAPGGASSAASAPGMTSGSVPAASPAEPSQQQQPAQAAPSWQQPPQQYSNYAPQQPAPYSPPPPGYGVPPPTGQYYPPPPPYGYASPYPPAPYPYQQQAPSVVVIEENGGGGGNGRGGYGNGGGFGGGGFGGGGWEGPALGFAGGLILGDLL